MLRKTLPLVESILALPLGWTTHVTVSPASHVYTTVAPYVPFANGIAISPDGTLVAVASTTLCEIRFYARDFRTGVGIMGGFEVTSREGWRKEIHLCCRE